MYFRHVTILHNESYSYSWNFSYALISGLEARLIQKGYYQDRHCSVLADHSQGPLFRVQQCAGRKGPGLPR
jgi:hypothetical protein